MSALLTYLAFAALAAAGQPASVPDTLRLPEFAARSAQDSARALVLKVEAERIDRAALEAALRTGRYEHVRITLDELLLPPAALQPDASATLFPEWRAP
jgi:hypothetical protein